MNRRAVHKAFVEERVDEWGDRYFVAACLQTGWQSDAYYAAYVYDDIPTDKAEARAIDRALLYLGDQGVRWPHFCDAEHEHA